MKRARRLLVSIVGLIGMGCGSGAPEGTSSRTQPLSLVDDDEIAASVVALGSSATASTASSEDNHAGLTVGPNVRVNAEQQAFPNGLLGRSETTVAATEDGRFVVVGFNDAQGFCGAPFGAACTAQDPPGLSGFGYSSDGGLTFTDGGGPPLFDNALTRGDPWLAVGGLGGRTFYFANLSVDATTGADLGVSVHRGRFSADGSFAWQDIRVFNAPNAPNDFYDKEAIAFGMGRYGGRGVVTLTNFREVCGFPAGSFGQIEAWRTADGGASWQGPAIVAADATNSDPADPDCGLGTLQQSSVPAVGPKGEIYVAWQFGPTFTATSTSTDAEIRVARSLDGGAHFDAPVTVDRINSMRQNPPVGYNRDRINDHPRITVVKEGPHRGRVIVTYYSAAAPVTAAPVARCPAPQQNLNCRAQRLTSSQVFVRYSDDRGATFGPAIAVAPAPPETGVKRLWPVVVSAEDGTVAVVYYESQEVPTAANPFCNVSVGGTLRRRGEANSLVDTYISLSRNGGSSFEPPVRMSSATSNWCTALVNIRPNFGDYIDAFAVEDDSVIAAWSDSRNGPVDTFFAAARIDD